MSPSAGADIPLVNAHTHFGGTLSSGEGQEEGILSFPSFTPGDVIPEKIRYFSAGYHPAKAAEFSEEALRILLEDPRCSAVGECGLDPFAPVKLEVQQEIFSRQMRLAREYGKGMVIHCVRRFPEILSLRKKEGGMSGIPWLIHGFRANETIGRILLKENCILSLSPVWLRHQQQFPSWLKKGKFLLETDMEGNGSLPELYRTCAILCGEDLSGLKQKLHHTFLQFISPAV